MTTPIPPILPGYGWRAMRLHDAPALLRLEIRCAENYGNRIVSTLQSCEAKLDAVADRLATRSICAADENGELAAAGLVSIRQVGNEIRASLDGNVASAYGGRGMGTFLLSWMETAASTAPEFALLDKRRMLCVNFLDQRNEAIPLLDAYGYHMQVSEYELRRSLEGELPDCPLPAGYEFASWTPERAPSFFKVYQDAFRERPGFPGWTEETWRSFFVECSEFRADLTLLVLADAQPAGYVICHIYEPDELSAEPIGGIAQLGVGPAWRRRGLASAMLCEAMRRFRNEGLTTTALEVNVNNPQALSVYLKTGYQHHLQYTSYRKEIR